MSDLLLKFKEKDSELGVRRKTLSRLSEVFGVSETQIVHRALALMAIQTLPEYEPDDGPLSKEAMQKIQKAANKKLAKGEVLSRQTLF